MTKSITPQDVKVALARDSVSPILLLDVRRKPAFEAAPDRISGSSWRDPSEVRAWSAELPQGVPIVVYCVHGHEVSQSIAMRLGELGYESLYLEGGIEGWREVGGELEPCR